ncbi:MAG: hypothetical protein DI601_25545, partial [Azospirillum brasilense]
MERQWYLSSWRIAPSGGSGRLVTHLDTPPFSHRHHPVPAIAHRVHSRYTRNLADLPLSGRPVELKLLVRRFRCD